MQNLSVWGHKMVHSIDQWEPENFHFEVYLKKQNKTQQKTPAFVAGGKCVLEGRWRERTRELSSVIPQQPLSQPWRGPHVCLFGCTDNAEEGTVIKDKQKGKVWSGDLGKRPYAKVKGQNSCSFCSPTGSCTGRRNRDGPLGEEGGH